jgi:hypothetical protein
MRVLATVIVLACLSLSAEELMKDSQVGMPNSIEAPPLPSLADQGTIKTTGKDTSASSFVNQASFQVRTNPTAAADPLENAPAPKPISRNVFLAGGGLLVLGFVGALLWILRFHRSEEAVEES